MMKMSKQEDEFFRYFSDVEFVDVPQDPLARFQTDWSKRYDVPGNGQNVLAVHFHVPVMCQCGTVVKGDRITCPVCDKVVR